MKKVISISLAFLVLFSNIGFAMNTHFCGGEAVKTTFSIGMENPDCGMANMDRECPGKPTDQEGVKSKPCCENQHQVVQIDQTTDLKSGSAGINPVFHTALVHVLVQPLFFSENRQYHKADYSPPLPEKDIQVLFQTFLI